MSGTTGKSRRLIIRPKKPRGEFRRTTFRLSAAGAPGFLRLLKKLPKNMTVREHAELQKAALYLDHVLDVNGYYTNLLQRSVEAMAREVNFPKEKSQK